MRNFYKDASLLLRISTVLFGLALIGTIVGIIIDYDIYANNMQYVYLIGAYVLGIGSILLFLGHIAYVIYFKAFKKFKFDALRFYINMVILTVTIGLAFILFLMVSLDAWASGF